MSPHTNTNNQVRQLQESAIGPTPTTAATATATPRPTMNKLSEHSELDMSIAASDADGSSVDGMSQEDAQSTTNSNAKANAPVDLVKQETKYVAYLRYTILMLLLTSGIALSWGTWHVVRQADENINDSGDCPWGDSESTMDSFVQALEVNLKQALKSRLNAAFTLSASFTSLVLEVKHTNTIEWPQVTIPDLDARSTGLWQTTGFTELYMAPFVVPELQQDFEAYAVEQHTGQIQKKIYNYDGASTKGRTAPIWQIIAPFSDFDTQNSILRMLNLYSHPTQGPALRQMEEYDGAAVWTEFQFAAAGSKDAPDVLLFYPIFEDFKQVKLVGSLSLKLSTLTLLQQAIPFDLLNEDMSILMNSCSNNQSTVAFTFDGSNVTYDMEVGQVPKEVREQAALVTLPGAFQYGKFETGLPNVCDWNIYVVPTDVAASFLGKVPESNTTESEDESSSKRYIYLTIVVALLFITLLIVFLIYDWFVEKRQSVVVNIATKSSAIVENLFPAQVRDRMLQNMQERAAVKVKPSENIEKLLMNGGGDSGATPIDPQTGNKGGKLPMSNQEIAAAANQISVKQFLNHEGAAMTDLSTQPIADLFPNTTVLFADIAGFTAWSSQREPPQVFTLLESLYRCFDIIAGKLKVFKVETIGDCYMAVTGLPNPDDAHAVHMSRFAYQCLIGMKTLIRELEAILGPGTSDLSLRVGLHSGPVTAGVLRGEKSRFQLFGDTVNTASRMESTGERDRIQVSQETADLLMAAGKSHWLKSRAEKVVAKGKGELKTYWLDPTKKRAKKSHKDIRVAQEIELNKSNSKSNLESPAAEVPFDDKYARLIDWNVDVLLHHLARVISCRSRSPSRGSLVNHSSEVALLPAAINDVAEVVALPPFDADASKFRRARPDVSMLQQTRADLHEYVKRIALMYRDVPFHNFEHASHVTLCANKLLNRLINSDEYDTEVELHDSTFGISSDPLTHFAIVFAALIHDADHTGLPNAQLVKDHHDLANRFENKSVAEQNSVHMGWEMLMDPRFERLRKCIYQTNVERKRFRQLTINSVMATDIADREVNEARQNKWDRAFRRQLTDGATTLQIQEDMNRKATAVIEHIIQVSDVAHTMQHWHIYRRWNERLFHEMHESFTKGGVLVDPASNWYIGELGFFDYYLIPLAMKLKECGVFGASGYEYISYVLKNKKEWERKGRQVVQEMVLLYKDVEDENNESDLDSDYDSDDLEYDSPGDLSSESESEDDDSATSDIDDSVGPLKLTRPQIFK